MSEISFGIRLTAEGNAFIGTVKLAKDALQGLGDTTENAGRKMRRGLDDANTSAQGLSRGIIGAVGQIRTLIATGGALAIAKHMAEASDNAALLHARMALVTSGVRDQANAERELFSIAQRLQLPYQALADTYPRLARAIRDYGGSTSDALDVTRIFAQTVRVSGANTAEAASSALQFAQAIGSGKLAGDELRSVLENNSRLAKALADGLGVTVGQLKILGEEGKLTSEKVVKAILSQKEVLEREAASMPQTIKGSFTALMNEIDKSTVSSNSMNASAGLLTITVNGLTTAVKKLREAGAFELPFLNVARSVDQAGVRFFGPQGASRDSSYNNAESARFERQAERVRAQEAAAQSATRSFRELIKTTESAEGVNAKYVDEVEKIMVVWGKLAEAGELTAEREAALTAAIQGETNKRGAAISELAKKGQASLSAIVAVYEQQANQSQALAQSQERIATDSYARQIQLMDAFHQNALLDERTYIYQREVVDRASAEARLKSIREQIAAEENARRQIAATPARDKSEEEQKNARLLASDRQLAQLRAERIIAERNLGQVVTDRQVRELALDQRIKADKLAIGDKAQEYVRALRQQSDEDRVQLSLIGQSEAAQAAVTAERRVRLQVESDIRDVEREIAQLERDLADPALIENRRRLIQTMREEGEKRAADAKAFASEIALASQNAYALSNAFHAIDDAAFETFKRFKDGWRSAAQYAAEQIRQYIVRLLYEISVQRLIIGVVGGGAAGANASPAMSGTSAVLGQAANSYIASAVSGLGSSALNWAGTAMFGAEGGAAFSAAAGAGFSAGVETLSIAAAAGAEAVGGFAAVLGAAIPVIGWIVAIGAVLYSLFGHKGGGPKTGGSFLGTFDSSGRIAQDLTPTLDRSRYLHDETNADSAARKLAESMGVAFAQSITRLGGKTDGFQFGVGFSRDTAGDAPSMVSTMVRDRQGNILFNQSNRDVSRDDGEIEKEVQLQFERALLATLQSDEVQLSATLKKVLATVNPGKGTKEEIEALIQLVQAWHDILDLGARDIVADSQEAYKAATRTALESVRAQADALVELANKFDGSAAQTQVLAQAQATYRGSLISLLVGIEQVKKELGEMFGQTREKIERAGLTDDQLYQRLQQQAQDKYRELQNASDPAVVQRLAKDIDALYNQAFDMLSPENQAALKGQYLTNLDILDKTVNQKLTDLAAAIAEESKKPFEIVATKLDAAADKMLEAAQLQLQAAQINRDAAGSGSGDTYVYQGGARTAEAGV